ncbi:MAG: hypothetical protein FWB99_03170 [Treponema sp.]|nr:hypothetical protein [Treponema sp.]
MFRKKVVLFIGLALIANHVLFAQAVGIDTAISNIARDFSITLPSRSTIAVVSITSEHLALSNYIINELIFNLIGTGEFQVVPRNMVDEELVRRELLFQHADVAVDPATQARLRGFAGADTLITGEVTRETPTTYRLMITAIHAETLTFQAASAASVLIDRQMSTLTGGDFFEDFTTAERLRMGALNMFGGAGSITNGQRLGWGVAAGQGVGILLIAGGLLFFPSVDDDFYDGNQESRRTMFIAGGAAIGGAIIFGYIIPFFHTRPNPAVASSNNFPFNFELVSSNNRVINGLRVSHTMRF